MPTNLGTKIRELRKQKKLTQTALAKKAGISQSALSDIESQTKSPSVDTISLLASALEVTVSQLMGEDIQNIAPNLEYPAWRTVPLIGEIACGEPIIAQENIEGFVQVDGEVACDFALRCKGDSMAPRLLDGDLVFIRQQPSVEQGQIAAVLIGSEATLKHVYVSSAGVQLIADNPAYAPIILTGEDAQNVRILGKAVAYRRII